MELRSSIMCVGAIENDQRNKKVHHFVCDRVRHFYETSYVFCKESYFDSRGGFQPCALCLSVWTPFSYIKGNVYAFGKFEERILSTLCFWNKIVAVVLMLAHR